MAFTTILSPESASQFLGEPGWVFVDCRFELANPAAGRSKYDAAHLPGAVYAHLDDDLSSPATPTSGRHPLPDPAGLTRTLSRWGVGPGKQVVAYDDAGGAFAARLWWLLKWLGHDAVAVLDGGYPAWVEAGLPVTSDPPSAVASAFTGAPDDSLWITSGQLAAAVAEHSVLLLDARAPARYRGEVEPVDPVAGHVPGAENAPYPQNLGDDGRFLPPERLRTRFAGFDELAGGKPVVHMCGSGVTACHNALAREAAGLPRGRLYAGSWSEWIRDPARPVATGQ